MASDQMSISSKKQQQLEAGKKRLEEFRNKKKAAAKKAASTNSTPSTNGDVHVTKPSVSDLNIHITTDNTSDSGSGFHAGKNDTKTINAHEAEPHLDHDTLHAPQDELNNKIGFNAEYGFDAEKHIHINSNHFSITRLENALKNSRDDRLMDFTSASPQVSITKSSSERPHGSSYIDQPADGITFRDSSSEAKKSIQSMLNHRYPSVSAVDNNNQNNLFNFPANEDISSRSSESISTSFRSEAVPSHDPTSMSEGLADRRSRLSFLDSITVSRNDETDKPNPFSSKIHHVDPPVLSNSQSFMNSSVTNDSDSFIERRNDFNSTKQNEDFAALEQHIEDLTQEKFSLQRSLEASRVLAESLATENSALTDTYNQQGGVVNQLKLDMERLQEEIKAQLVELEAVRTEYGNAQLECSAADERSKLLASEVIGLEEKALRLRSNELKLERKLENMEAEMSSQMRRISSLEKDRQDLQLTIEALQEEKKLMLSKLRKAPAVANSADIKKNLTTKKEASTSTGDLDESEDTLHATTNLTIQATVGESDTSLSRNLGLEVSSSSIPLDQTRMIQNINTLISELASEKEELMQALLAKSSLSSKLKDLNKELSQKLEIQTQRLELLTSQSMMSTDNNIPQTKSAPRTVVDNTPYADEGDEVVERVLGWIMKLFPEGPSKRQTKHL